MSNIPITNFNSGELTPRIAERIDTEKYSGGCRRMENFIATIYGPAERRPGTYFVAASYIMGQNVKLIPFVYSSTIAYLVELGELYMRFFYADAVVSTVVSPFTTEQNFRFQFQQIADVMRIAEPHHAQQKLSRTTATTFALEDIDFRTGPFLTRNDLIDPDNLSPSQMRCTSLSVGSYAAIISDGNIFFSGHVGALFKFMHPRETTISSGTMLTTNTGVMCSGIDVYGTWSFRTHGSWTGTIVLERNENLAGWETFRTYVSGNPADVNVSQSFTEDSDNVQYRVSVTEHATSSTISGEITIEDSTQEGVVRITSVSDSKHAVGLVISALASTDFTKRWFEGAWSDFRGHPSTIAFFEDRCVYAGGIPNSERQEEPIPGYPELRGL
jgi:hypothetical protein